MANICEVGDPHETKAKPTTEQVETDAKTP
jgi:hypothetical protein